MDQMYTVLNQMLDPKWDDIGLGSFYNMFGYEIFENTLRINVGEHKPLEVRFFEGAAISIFKSTSNSIVALLSSQTGDKEVVTVRWSNIEPFPEDRSSAIISAINDGIPTPEYRHSETLYLNSTSVVISFRSYIDGCTVRDCWDHLSTDDRNHIMLQLRDIISIMHSQKAPRYGFVAGAPVSSACSSDYIAKLVCRSKILNHLDKNTEIQSDCVSNGRPTLCHYNLNPDHIIVRDNIIVGIIGWSGADYAPISMEYIWYCFKMCETSDASWYDDLVDYISCEDKSGDKFYNTVLDYIYKLSWSNWPREYRPAINFVYFMLRSDKQDNICASRTGDITSHITPDVQTHGDFLKSPPSTARNSRTSYGTWSEISSTCTRTNPFSNLNIHDGLGQQ